MERIRDADVDVVVNFTAGMGGDLVLGGDEDVLPLDAEGTALYALLVASPSHAQGALSMMAAWDLSAGRQTLRALRCPVRMLVGGQDRTVPPSLAVSALPWLQDGQLATWPDFGHLVHEEAPKDTLDHLRRHLLLE